MSDGTEASVHEFPTPLLYERPGRLEAENVGRKFLTELSLTPLLGVDYRLATGIGSSSKPVSNRRIGRPCSMVHSAVHVAGAFDMLLTLAP